MVNTFLNLILMIKVKGKVMRGKGEGKLIGYPTANVQLTSPIDFGVYAGTAAFGGKIFPGAVFIGRKDVLEVHILGFNEDVYGKEIEVEIKEKIRDVVSFESVEKMKILIQKDIEKITQSNVHGNH